MGKSDTNNTTALAQAFGVIGNGLDRDRLGSALHPGVCTVKLGHNR